MMIGEVDLLSPVVIPPRPNVHFEEALGIYRRIYGEKAHPVVADSLQMLGLGLAIKGSDAIDISTGYKYQRKALEMYKSIYGEKHGSVARCLSNLGLTLSNLDQNEEARKCFEQALDIFGAIHATDDQSIATTHANLAHALEDMGQLTKAHHHFDKALLIRRKVYGSDNYLVIAVTLEDLGNVLSKLGNESAATEHARAADKIRERLNAPRSHAVSKRWSSQEVGLTKDDMTMD
jgi:tetratricopeptide (TPR) repeat protein